jgi:hypothetical protein
MSMRLVSGGTYNVRASEMAAHIQDTRPKTVTCVVHFLDDSQEVFEVDVRIIHVFKNVIVFVRRIFMWFHFSFT